VGKPFTVFGRPGCPWCDKVKELLASAGQPFDYIDLSVSPGVRAEMIAQGFKTVPQVLHETTWVGGYEDTEVFLKGVPRG
jgi:glutaredoxin 1